jgi:hypothetical protein
VNIQHFKTQNFFTFSIFCESSLPFWIPIRTQPTKINDLKPNCFKYLNKLAAEIGNLSVESVENRYFLLETDIHFGFNADPDVPIRIQNQG